MEIVDGIGEVKSDLDKTEFKKVIRKLADKKIIKEIMGVSQND